MIVKIMFCLLAGYVFGSIPFGFLVGKLYKLDITKQGSGNVGATNALRTLGIKGAILTFAGDVLKISIPIFIVRFGFPTIEPCWEIIALYLGIGAVIGHNYPCWLKFKGGKGIAVTSGVLLSVADWRVTVIGLLLFIAIVAITRYASLGSLMVAWLLPVHVFLFYREDAYFIHILILTLVFTSFAYFRHMENIKRLLSGTERKVGIKHE